MLQKLTWMSLALLVVTIVYWAIVYHRSDIDARNIRGDQDYRFVSGNLGNCEAAWLFDRRSVLIWIATQRQSGSLPIVSRFGVFPALFGDRLSSIGLRGVGEIERFGVSRIGGRLKLNFATASGSPVTIRLLYMPLDTLCAVLGILPGIALIRWSFRRNVRWMKYVGARRRRRTRLRLGECVCGYDLRHTHGRCPECGRTVRWVPVAIGEARRMHS